MIERLFIISTFLSPSLKNCSFIVLLLFINYFLWKTGHFQVALNLRQSNLVSAKPLKRTNKFMFMRKVLHLALF